MEPSPCPAPTLHLVGTSRQCLAVARILLDAHGKARGSPLAGTSMVPRRVALETLHDQYLATGDVSPVRELARYTQHLLRLLQDLPHEIRGDGAVTLREADAMVTKLLDTIDQGAHP